MIWFVICLFVAGALLGYDLTSSDKMANQYTVHLKEHNLEQISQYVSEELWTL